MDINSRDPSQNIIPFRIKGVDVARFDSAGNLGIGTNAPTTKLDVAGAVQIVGSLNIVNSNSSGNESGITLNGVLLENKMNSAVVVNMDSQPAPATALNRQKKQSIPLSVASTLSTSDVVAKMSGVSVGKSQTYGVGPSQMASYGNIVVAVGEGTNSIAYSLTNPPTAASWVGIPGIFSSRGRNIAYANGTWVAVGSGTNSIAYSTMTPPIASSWVVIPLGTNINGVGNMLQTEGINIAYGNGAWVAVGLGTNGFAYSLANPPTAESWVGIPLSFSSTIFGSNAVGITFANGTWVATGTGTNSIAYSTRTPPTADSWVVVPITNTNDAGVYNTFTSQGVSNIIYANGVWLVGGSGTNTLCYSVENPPIASSWVPITNSVLLNGRSIAYGNGTWVAWGDNGLFAYSTSRIPHSSSWVSMKGPTPSSSNEVLYNISFNAATNTWYFTGDIGTNCLFYSTATPPVPATWVGVPRSTSTFTTQAWGAIGITTPAYTSPINVARLDNKVTFPANRMLAVGGGSDVLARSSLTPSPAVGGTISYSDDDGATWAMVPGGATNAMFSSAADISANTSFGVGGTRGANAVAWNGEKWVAAGNGRTHSLAFSDDGGMTWSGVTGKSIFSVEARDVAWNGQMWVAVGRGAAFSTAYSYDGVTWMGPVDASGAPINVFSLDIAGPTAATSDISGGGNHVIWTGKTWVATGTRTLIAGSSPAAYYTMAYSTDGKTWTGVPDSGATSTGFDMYAHGVAWNGRNYVATGRGTVNTLVTFTDVTASTTAGAAAAVTASWQGLGNSVFSVWGRGITWGAKRWMATGRGTNTVAYSTNGRNWQGCGANVFKPLRRFMAMGDTPLYTSVSSGQPQRGVAFSYSDDGITWDVPVVNQGVEFSLPIGGTSDTTRSVIFTNNTLLTNVITDNATAHTALMYSADGGSSWARVTGTSDTEANGGTGMTVANGGSYSLAANPARTRFLVGGGDTASSTKKVYFSNDGFNWRNSISSPNSTQMAWVHASLWVGGIYNRWLIGGSDATTNANGRILRSLDADAADQWTTSAVYINSVISCFAANTDFSVILAGAASGNKIYRSTDGGLSFPGTIDITSTPTGSVRSITFSPSLGRWVAVGGGAGAANTIIYSTDATGTAWVAPPSQAKAAATAIFKNGSEATRVIWDAVGGRFLVGGWNGAATTATLTNVAGLDGTNNNPGYTMAYSADGINWTPVTVQSSDINTGSSTFGPFLTRCRDLMALDTAGDFTPVNTGYSVTWNSYANRFVATGNGTCPVVYSNDGGVTWTPANQQPPQQAIAVAGGASTAASTTSVSPLTYTIDGKTWFQGLGAKEIFGTGVVNAVEYGQTSTAISPTNGRIWVAGGAHTSGTSCLAFSQNGIRWTAITSATTMMTNVRTIVYAPVEQLISTAGANNAAITAGSGVGNGIWVAGGDTTNSLIFSYDGISWSEVPSSLTILSRCNAIAFGNGLFVAGGIAAIVTTAVDTTANMFYSTDGIAWRPIRNSMSRISPNASISSIAYGRDENGRGIWVAGTSTASSSSISVLYSYNGIDWAGVANSGSTISSLGVTSIAYGLNASTGRGLWIAGVNRMTADGNAFVVSTNGRDGWTAVPNTKTGLFDVSGGGPTSVSYFNGVWYATGSSAGISTGRTLAYSYDGSGGWFGVYPTTNIYGSSLTTFSLTDMRCVATTNDYILPSGASAGSSVSSGTAAASFRPAGMTTVRSIGWTAGIGSAYLQHPTILVGGENGRSVSAISADGGRTWGSSTTSLARSAFRGGVCNDLFWNGSTWVAVGHDTVSGAKVATSKDGVSWSQIPGTSIPITGVLNTIAWNGSMWMVGGDGSPINDANTASFAWSSNLTSWNAIANTDISLTVVKRIAWNGMYWVAVGQGSGTTIMYSKNRNGLVWEDTFTAASGSTTKTSAITTVVNDVVWGGGRWVAVGRGNSVADGSGVSILYSVDTPAAGPNAADYAVSGRRWVGVAASAHLFPYGANSVAWNGKRFIATGPAAASCSTSNIIAWSADGISWNAYSTAKTVAPGQRWVAVGSGSRACVATSADGRVWTDVANSAALFSDISGASTALVNTMKTGARAVGWNGSSLIVGGARSATTITPSSQATASSTIGRTTIPVCAFIGSGNGVMGGGTTNTSEAATHSAYTRVSSSVFITHMDVNIREANAPWANMWLNTYTDLSGTQLFQVTPEMHTFSSALKWNGWSWVANFGMTTFNPLTGDQYGSIWYCTDPLARVGWSVASNSAAPRILIGQGGYAALEWNGVAWLACGYDPNNNNLIYTTDKYGAMGWTAVSGIVSGAGSASFQPVCIASSSRFWVVGGSQGTTSAMYFTSDRTGATGWRAIATTGGSVLPGIRISSVGYNGSAWICCGGGGGGTGSPACSISWRADTGANEDIGTGWATATNSGTSGGIPQVLTNNSSIAYNTGASSPIWVVVGHDSANNGSQIAYTATVNGSTEWKVATGTLTNTIYGHLTGIAWTGYSWIATSAAGSGRILSTMDATAATGWNTSPTQSLYSPTLNTNAVAFVNIPISLLTTGMPSSAGAGAGTGAMWRAGTGRAQGLLTGGGTETTSVIVRSSNGAEGTSWSQVYSRNFLIAVGGGVIRDASGGGGTNRMAYSYDGGLSWTTNNSTVLTNAATNAIGTIRTVKYGNGMWVAGGDSVGSSVSGNNCLAWSRDGVNWVGAGGTQIFGSAGACYAVCCNDRGRWVAVGGAPLGTVGTYTNTTGSIYTMAWSDDGMNWTPILGSRALFGIVCQGVSYGADASGVGMWTAIGRGTTYTGCAYSYDGKTWFLSQTSGSLFGTSANVLTERYAPVSSTWRSVSLSSTGQYQTCGGEFGMSRYIHTSSDYGVSWTPRTTPGSLNWRSVSLSSTGQYQTAVVYTGTSQYIHTSSDYGVTWTPRTTPGNMSWHSVSLSSTGQYQTAVVDGGNIHTSSDYGVTWTPRTTPGIRIWYSVSLSSTGQYQTAVVYGGNIHTSSDYGVSWTPRTTPGNLYWRSVSLSSTGQYQTAVVFTSTSMHIHTSSDYGVTWTPRTTPGSRIWYSVSLSSTGQYQTAVVYGGNIHTSSDYGVNWTPRTVAVNLDWYSVSLSSTGQYQTAVVENGPIYISSNFGETWSSAATDSRSLGVAYGKDANGAGMWVVAAGRRDRDISANVANTMAYSYDGKLWRGITAASGLSEQAWSVAYGKDGFGVGMWVAAGYDVTCGLKWSYDGVTWNATMGASGAAVWAGMAAGRRALAVYWNGSMWLASTSDTRNGEPRGTSMAVNNASSVPGYLLYSYNGKNWLPVLAPNTYAATISASAQPSIYSVLPNPAILDFGSFYDDQSQRGVTIANTTARTVGAIMSGVPVENVNTIVPYGKGSMTTGQVPFLLGGDSGLMDLTPFESSLYTFTSHTFTNADQTGREGPELTTVRSAYIAAGATWATTYVNMTTRGIQEWTVPATGSYTIRAVGAGGGDLRSVSKGRDIQLSTTLTKGEVIKILVGQQGRVILSAGGGGGGTFVVRGTQIPIIIAGGGGGGGTVSSDLSSNASIATNGNAGSGGGIGGNSGGGGAGEVFASGGGGLLGSGAAINTDGGSGGSSFISGGLGSTSPTNTFGGFGGGGGAYGNGGGGGGGGGYSGGGGGNGGGSGGGGGSFGITTLTDNGAINTGHGSVTITANFPITPTLPITSDIASVTTSLSTSTDGGITWRAVPNSTKVMTKVNKILCDESTQQIVAVGTGNYSVATSTPATAASADGWTGVFGSRMTDTRAGLFEKYGTGASWFGGAKMWIASGRAQSRRGSSLAVSVNGTVWQDAKIVSQVAAGSAGARGGGLTSRTTETTMIETNNKELYSFLTFMFDNAGAVRRQGPELDTVRTSYTNRGATWVTTYLTMTSRGIQLWTVPATGIYRIRAKGAGGGNAGSFGRGRDIELQTKLIKGEVIQILVGQAGQATFNLQGGGGGGTFVIRGTQTPIIVAGGGGGRGGTLANEYINSNASVNTSGNKGGDGTANNGDGGINGNGGLNGYGGGGGGLLGSGGGNPNGGGGGGASFIQGFTTVADGTTFIVGRGEGGVWIGGSGGIGGFGGGGGAEYGGGGGGGGGYSGGGGGHSPTWASGGGGGSYGINPLIDYGANNTGHGSVTITLIKYETEFYLPPPSSSLIPYTAPATPLLTYTDSAAAFSTQVSSVATNSQYNRAVVGGSGVQFVAGGRGGTGLVVSNDGQNWTAAAGTTATVFQSPTNTTTRTGSGGFDASFGTVALTQRLTTPATYPSGGWHGVSLSSSGQYQSACIASAGNHIYTSSDYGVTWTQRTQFTGSFLSISLSSTGQYQSAVNGGNGYIYTSSDFGVTWSERTSAGAQNWRAIAVSSTGQYQSAAGATRIWTSSDYGVTWTARTQFSGTWYSVSLSSTGQYQSVTNLTGGSGAYIYTSSDYGVSWTQRTQFTGEFRTISISSTGQYQSAVIQAGGDGAYIYTSSDYGVYWIKQLQYTGQWRHISLSSTGQYQSALIEQAGDGGGIYTSSDYGVTWTKRPYTDEFMCISLSSSGQYQTAVTYDAGSLFIYTSTDFGVTWVQRSTATRTNAFTRVRSSASGQYQLATSGPVGNLNGQLYVSSDYGRTWMPRRGLGTWLGGAVSATGAVMASLSLGQPTKRWTFTKLQDGDGELSFYPIPANNRISFFLTIRFQNQTAINYYSNGTWGSEIVIYDIHNLPNPSTIYISFDVVTGWKVEYTVSGVAKVAILPNHLGVTSIDNINNTYTTNFGSKASITGPEIISTAILRSTDYGNTFTDVPGTTLTGSAYWRAIATTNSAATQTAVAYGGAIFRSSDYGSSWTNTGITIDGSANANTIIPRNWQDVAISAETGAVQVTCVSGGYLYVSSDTGANWVSTTVNIDGVAAQATNRAWQAVAVSANGQYGLACVNNGYLYRSVNSGATWVSSDINIDNNGIQASPRWWQDVGISANGKYQVACSLNSGNIFYSKNYGASWTSLTAAGSRAWSSVALSENGSTISATTNDASGGVWVYSMPDDQYYQPSTLTNSGSTTAATVRAIAYGNSGTGAAVDGYWVAGADASANSLAYSSNGIDWTAVVGSKTTLFNAVNGVAYGADAQGTPMWVAVGQPFVGSVPGTTAYSIAYSYNMTTWVGVRNAANFTGQANHVAYGQDEFGAGVWVAVGQADGVLSANLGDSALYNSNGNTNTTIFYSYDGANWAAGTGAGVFASSGTDVVWGVDASGVGMWVATGIGYTDPLTGVVVPGGQVAHSTNGRVWTPIMIPVTTTLPATSHVHAIPIPPASIGFVTPTYGGDWGQLGLDISGTQLGEQSGYSVSISADGTVVAIGSYAYDVTGGSNQGRTRIYKFNNGTASWNQLGPDISGNQVSERSGNSVSLSADGNTVAIGSLFYGVTTNGNEGRTRIYKFNNGTSSWNQLGLDISGNQLSEQSGISVSLSADGTTVAIGSAYYDKAGGPTNNNTDEGRTRIYKFNNGTSSWNQLGLDISGNQQSEYSGFSVSLSADGNTVAIGSLFYGVTTNGNEGRTRIYKFNNGTSSWNQLGLDISGNQVNEQSGYSVSLSADGTTVAIGSYIYDVTTNGNEGRTRIYKFNNGTSSWNQLGADISANQQGENSGVSVSLSADGTTVAIGSFNYNVTGANHEGRTRIYKFNNGTSSWNQLGFDIYGNQAIENSGFRVSLSADGTTVAIASYIYDVTGTNTEEGRVRIYRIPVTNPITYTSSNTSIAEIYGNTLLLIKSGASGTTNIVATQGSTTTNGVLTVSGTTYTFLYIYIFTPFPGAVAGDLPCVAYGRGGSQGTGAPRWIVGGGGGTNVFAMSSAPTTIGAWSVVASNAPSANAPFPVCNSLGYSNGVWVAGNNTSATNILARSIDGGATWTPVTASSVSGILTGAAAVGANAFCNFSLAVADYSNDTNLRSWVAVQGTKNFMFDGGVNTVATPTPNVSAAVYNAVGQTTTTIASAVSVMVPPPEALATTYGANWGQLGLDISGNQQDENSGYSISVSADGTVVAIGSINYEEVGEPAHISKGRTRIYKYNGTSWNQLGQDISGIQVQEYSGIRVSLSADGTTVAIGSFGYDAAEQNAGRTRIYKYNGTSWNPLGSDIVGTQMSEGSGISVSLSADGTTVAIGSRDYDIAANGNEGRTRIYKYNGTSWGQLGLDISGNQLSENSGYSVSLSADGTTVAIGSHTYDKAGGPTNNNTDEGRTRIYKYNGTSWNPLGSDISGNQAGENSGMSVSLSADGTTVAIGSYTYIIAANGNEGRTRIYKYNGTSWNQLGLDISGNQLSENSGYSVSLSADGTTVAIGSYAYDTGANANVGRTRIYKYNGTSWNPLGLDISGNQAGEESGVSVSLSADGTTVAIGSHAYDIATNGNEGRVRIYRIPVINAITYTSSNSAVADICGGLLLIKSGASGTTNIVATQGSTVTNRTLTVSGVTYTLVYTSTSTMIASSASVMVPPPGALTPTYGADWPLLGPTIPGVDAIEQSGYSVSLSADGTTVAIGAYANSSSKGITRIYKYNAGTNTWPLLGPTIAGGDVGERSGYSVSLSADGTTVAIGAYDNSSAKGITRIYKYNAGTNTWPLLGPTIPGVDTFEQSGISVSLSADGTTVAIGALNNSSYKGITRIHKYNAGMDTWPLLGPTIPGVDDYEQSGGSVSLSADGTTVAIGARSNSSSKGITRIYKYNAGTNTWPLLGPTIPGVDASEQSGFSVSLSADGTTVAIGAYANSSSKGITRIYKYNAGTNTWPLLGSTIPGVDAGERSGRSVSLSADGTTVAIGAWNNSSAKGITRIYKYNAGTDTWPLLGQTIPGVDASEQSGWSVSLSADGTTVAIGAYVNSGSKGITRIHRIPTTNAITYTSSNSGVAEIYGNALLLIKSGASVTTNIVATQGSTATNGVLTVSGTTYLLKYSVQGLPWWVAGGRNQFVPQQGAIYLQTPGNASIAYTSDPSGATGWTLGTSNVANGGNGIMDLEQINDIAFSPHTQNWIAVGVGSAATPTRTALYSADGFAWTSTVVSAADASLNLNTCAWNQLDASASSSGRWLAGGTRSGVDASAVSLYISADVSGHTWTPIVGTGAILSHVYSLAFNGTVWIAAGTPATSNGSTSTLMRTTDLTGATGWQGIAATNVSTGGFDTAARSITWNAEQQMWFATGENTGSTADASFSSVIYSRDINGAAGTWRTVRESNSFCFSGEGTSIAFKGDKWFAAGQGTNQIVATTGTAAANAATATWTPIAHGTALTSISDITYTGRRLVATGSSSGGASNGVIYTTDNSGSVWTAAPATPGPGFTDALGGGTSITFEPSLEGGTGHVIATGRSASNTISLSTDGGVSWSSPSVQFSTTTLYANYTPVTSRTQTVGFPVLNSLPNWIIDISFTKTGGDGSWRFIIGSMYNSVDTGRGWAIWVGLSQQIHFSDSNATYDSFSGQISSNIAYNLNVIKVGNSVTLRLTNLSTMAVLTNTITITNPLGLGPVEIGGNSNGETFSGTIGYVVVSDHFKNTPSATTQPLFTTGGNSVAYVGNDTLFAGGSNDVQWTGKRWVATGRNTASTTATPTPPTTLTTTAIPPLIDIINNNTSAVATSDDGMTWQCVSASQAPNLSEGTVIASNSRIGPTPLINSQIIISDGGDTEPNVDYGGMTCGMGGSGTGVAQIDIIAELPPVSNAASSGAVAIIGAAGNGGPNSIGNAQNASFDTTAFAITTRPI